MVHKHKLAAFGIGTTQVLSSLTTNYIIYVPNYPFNFLFIALLTQSYNTIHFY